MTGRSLILLTAAALTLAGCGRMGDLEQPDARGEVATAPLDRITRDNDPAPPRTLPLPGGPSDPGAVAPQGVLPDPYAHPQ